ncbi:MAG: hypothetical protein J6P44_08465 [Bacteroidales bacterium]|nr:hypothetical protein [Bacteroidales bacterium]
MTAVHAYDGIENYYTKILLVKCFSGISNSRLKHNASYVQINNCIKTQLLSLTFQ